jgi:hypothetical protein
VAPPEYAAIEAEIKSRLDSIFGIDRTVEEKLLEISGPTSTQESKVQNQPTSVFGKPSTQESKTESQSASVFGPKKQTLFGPSGLFASQEPTFQPPLTHRKTSQNVTGLFRCLHGTETPQKGVWSPETIKPCQSSDLFGSLLGSKPQKSVFDPLSPSPT